MHHRGRGNATSCRRMADNPPAKAQDRMAGGQDLEGRIRDVGSERITLDDGTALFIPKGMAKQSDPPSESGAGSK